MRPTLVRLATAAALIVFGLVLGATVQPVQALPSFARQTGQPCGACHVDFPQLTPFGRRFKLGGYTLGGGDFEPLVSGIATKDSSAPAAKKAYTFGALVGSDKSQDSAEDKNSLASFLGSTNPASGGNSALAADSSKSTNWVPPIAVMAQIGFTRTRKDMAPSDIPQGFAPNNNLALQEASVFYAGRITENLGAFVQLTGDGVSKRFAWDNVDIRYARTINIGDMNAIVGITVNNNPTVQDPWNTTPAWSFPFISSAIAPTPAATTLIEESFGQLVAGVGGYAWINDIFYAELTGYKTLPPKTLSRFGVDVGCTTDPNCSSPISVFDRVAPYWRVAVEPTWGQHSFQIGTFGMTANVVPQQMFGFGTDQYTDFGFDSQYQYHGDDYYVTLRSSLIYEKQKLDASRALGFADNSTNRLRSFRASASFVYGNDYRLAFTGSRFSVDGSRDATLYSFSANGLPNSSGWIAEVAYIPYGMNKSPLWPWWNARFGIQYTAYDKFNGASADYDGTGRNARDNNTLLLYAWVAM